MIVIEAEKLAEDFRKERDAKAIIEEIATIADASLSAVKMRVYRGLEQLKQLMNK
jgi:DNA-directed RNA polymerase specialized sigma24 family protein